VVIDQSIHHYTFRHVIGDTSVLFALAKWPPSADQKKRVMFCPSCATCNKMGWV